MEHRSRPRPGVRPESLPRGLLDGLLVTGLAVILTAGLVSMIGGSTTLGWLALAGTGLVGLAVVGQRRTQQAAAERERSVEASLRRLVQGLGRSTSPETVVATMIDALRGSATADHVVVARRHPGERDIEAILVTATASVPLATTRLPGELLETLDPSGAAVSFRSAEAKAIEADGPPSPAARSGPARRGDPGLVERLQADFGLRNVIARPLRSSTGPVGLLMLSRRTGGAWASADIELLETAAVELSLALERAADRQAAEHGARIDALTGLPNRRHFDELAELLSRGRRAGDALGVLMIDIDHFKRVNDTYGHAVGDVVLRSVAAQIAAGVRAADTPARFGGEEFAVLLRRATPDQACEVALRIRAAVAALETDALGIRDGQPVSVSVGVAVGAASGETVAELIRRADDALYTAKRRGRDRVVVDELAA